MNFEAASFRSTQFCKRTTTSGFLCPVHPLLLYLVYLLHSLSFGIELAVIYDDEIKSASVAVNWFGCEQTEDIFLDCCNSVMSPFHPWLYAYFAFLGHTETVCIRWFRLVGCFLFYLCKFISFVIVFRYSCGFVDLWYISG